jgi:hypothetical protein
MMQAFLVAKLFKVNSNEFISPHHLQFLFNGRFSSSGVAYTKSNRE